MPAQPLLLFVSQLAGLRVAKTPHLPPDNTATAKAETVAPTDAAVTSVPTNSPPPVIGELEQNYKEADISVEIKKKMFAAVFPSYENYVSSDGTYWNIPEDSPEPRITCDYYDVGDRILFWAKKYLPLDDSKLWFSVASFTYDGELNALLWKDRSFDYGDWQYQLFSDNDKLYVAFTNPYEGDIFSWGRRITNAFYVYELRADKAEIAWSESMYFPGDVFKGDSIETCYEAYSWKLNGDGVDMYFYNEDYETKGYDFIRHYSFEELLSGVDVTK